jgi:hypothetical protein
MNSIVALPIAAAVPVARPSIAAAGATQADDPIFAAIEAHRRAFEATNKVLLEHGDLEETLPKGRISEWEEKIFETDAPEWIASERVVRAFHDAETEAALQLAGMSPVTTAGAAAILAYSVEQPCKIGCKYPQFDDDDGVTRPFEFFVIQNAPRRSQSLRRPRGASNADNEHQGIATPVHRHRPGNRSRAFCVSFPRP